jgi:transcription initiation factor TFIIB
MVDPIKCIARVADKIEISEKTKHQAINPMNSVIKNEISADKDPMGLAAMVIYACCISYY